ncbi:hypothetical protein [Streptomyces sp. NPDC000994]
MRPLDPAIVDRLAEMFRADVTDAAAARAIGISKSTAGVWRRRLGIAPSPRTAPANRSVLTLEQKWRTYARPVADGHMEWTGRRRGDTGTMVMTHHGREYTARRVAFIVAHGREPEGRVTAECDHPGCVAPACVEDDPSRTHSRGQLAAVLGYATPLTECNRGHATAEHRRYDRDGRPYCRACHIDRQAA